MAFIGMGLRAYLWAFPSRAILLILIAFTSSLRNQQTRVTALAYTHSEGVRLSSRRSLPWEGEKGRTHHENDPPSTALLASHLIFLYPRFSSRYRIGSIQRDGGLHAGMAYQPPCLYLRI